jgi:uncharacterized protein (TIGR03437 family)
MLSLTRCSLLLAVCAPVWSQTLFPSLNQLPSKEFGHAKLIVGSALGTAPNLLEGREFFNPAAVAVDTSSSPAILYVADSNNHRVLAWQNPSGTSVGDFATRVIGQRDMYSGFAGGPGAQGGALTAAGLTLPSALAVDSDGNLYVLDGGNNRILRFPKPLSQPGDFPSPDLVIGQKTAVSGNQVNEGQPKPSEKTLAFRSGNSVGGAMAFDGQGNLWVADIFNHRVLRFPKARLTGSEPAADLVLGQALFTTNDYTPEDFDHRDDLDSMNSPVALAIDSRGAIYVSDKLLRVLYYASPSSGGLATRVLGIQPAPQQGQANPTYPTEYSLGLVSTLQGSATTYPAQCLFTSGTVLFVCDTVAHRLLRYNSPEQWPAATATAPSPAAVAVFGQNTMNDGTANRGQGAFQPNGNTLNVPVGAAFLNNDLWVVDGGNNRVLSLPMAPGTFNLGNATRVLGQKTFDTYAPNLVEGRELFVNNASGYHGSTVIVDRTSTPNHVYIADSLNNRILGFKDVRQIGVDQWSGAQLTQPDIIIGQPDKIKTGPNYPSYDSQIPSDQGLYAPSGLAVDKDGNLWVADSGNGRVLRFPSPFNQTGGAVPRANLVLGQTTFTFTVPDPSSNTMGQPVSVVVFNNGDVAAADLRHNRVLLWRKSGADFANGQTARAVLGQQNFFTTTASSSSAGLSAPRGMTVDTGDRLYVADTGNNRVVVYNGTGNIANGATGIVIQSNLNQPESVAVSPATGNIWVASGGNGYLFRFNEYSQLGTGPQPLEQVPSYAPIAIALDANDNMLIVEATNRLTFYYGSVIYRNAANYTLSRNVRNAQGLDSNSNSLTPGMYTVIARSPNIKPFAFTPGAASLPFPKKFGGVEVLINGIPSAIWRMDGASIVFLMPNAAPTGGDVEIMVRDSETKEILGAGTYAIGPAAPGFFTANQGGTGQISATNADGTPNTPTNRAAMDSVFTIWMNGYGHLDNAPDDGVPAGRAFETDVKPVIYVQAYQVPPENIYYSGLSPEFPGLWQINFKLPKVGDKNAPVPGDKIQIIVIMRDIPSNVIGRDGGAVRLDDQFVPITDPRITTIAIK